MSDETKPWDGRPENPERDGTHLLNNPEGLLYGLRWSAAREMWDGAWGRSALPSILAQSGYSYLGPCPPPSDHAALLAERDALRARVGYWQNACAEHGGRYWEARCRDAEAALAAAEKKEG